MARGTRPASSELVSPLSDDVSESESDLEDFPDFVGDFPLEYECVKLVTEDGVRLVRRDEASVINDPL